MLSDVEIIARLHGDEDARAAFKGCAVARRQGKPGAVDSSEMVNGWEGMAAEGRLLRSKC